MDEKILEWARIIWDYHRLHQPLKKSDCIVTFGSHDLRVAEWAAKIYLAGWAPILVFSGGLGRLTSDIWTETEAEKFASVAKKMGVSVQAILIEKKSTNTGENIAFTRQLLKEKGLSPTSIILVQKPYMERRSYASVRKQWPEMEVVVSSPPLSLDAYPNDEITLEKVINIMVGDLERIKTYPLMGYQIEQEVPPEVEEAFYQLVKAGYNKQLIKSV